MKISVIEAKGKKTAEVLIYEDIGEGWFGGLSAKAFAKELQAIGAVDKINVRINSMGGSVFEGVTMYNVLRDNDAEVIVHIDGLAASIASVIAMAGNSIRIAENAMMMIHDPWIVAAGSAADLREQAGLLDKIRDSLITSYKSQVQASLTTDEISNLMEAETWMSANEALEFGFVDEVTEELAVAAKVVDLSHYRYKHAPENLKELVFEGETKPVKREVNEALQGMRAHLKARKL